MKRPSLTDLQVSVGRGRVSGKCLLAVCAWSLALLMIVPARGEEEFLDPQEAFRFSALLTGAELEVRYRIADGYYMYRDRYRFTVQLQTGEHQIGELQSGEFQTEGSGVAESAGIETGTFDAQSVERLSIELGPPMFPAGEWHEDEFFGRSEIYRHEVTIRIPLVITGDMPGAFRLLAVSQGCADGGICYLPLTQSRDFRLLGRLGLPGRRP